MTETIQRNPRSGRCLDRRCAPGEAVHVGIHVLLGRYLARLPSGPRALRRRRQDRDRAAVDRHVALIAQPVLATDEFDGTSSGIIIYISVRSDIFIEIHYDSEAERR